MINVHIAMRTPRNVATLVPCRRHQPLQPDLPVKGQLRFRPFRTHASSSWQGFHCEDRVNRNAARRNTTPQGVSTGTIKHQRQNARRDSAWPLTPPPPHAMSRSVL